jgi:hypothetical protein
MVLLFMIENNTHLTNKDIMTGNSMALAKVTGTVDKETMAVVILLTVMVVILLNFSKEFSTIMGRQMAEEFKICTQALESTETTETLETTNKDGHHMVIIKGMAHTVQAMDQAMEVQGMESMTGNIGLLNFSKEFTTLWDMGVVQILADKLPTGNNTRCLREEEATATTDMEAAMVPIAKVMVAMEE